MAEVSGGAIRLIDRDGDPLDDGNGKLNINATLEAASVNIGDVDVLSVPAPLSTTGDGTRSGVLRVTLASDSSMPNTDGYTTIAHRNNCDVDTSPETLTTSTACKHVDIMATTTNAGIIYVGASGVSAATGIALYAGDVYSVDIDNLADIYVIASQVNQAVQWVYYV